MLCDYVITEILPSDTGVPPREWDGVHISSC